MFCDWAPLDRDLSDEEFMRNQQQYLDEFKQVLVPFECQMPYWLIGYADRSSTSLGQKLSIINRMFGVAFSRTKADFLRELGTK